MAQGNNNKNILLMIQFKLSTVENIYKHYIMKGSQLTEFSPVVNPTQHNQWDV